jgi:hypothetical protein
MGAGSSRKTSQSYVSVTLQARSPQSKISTTSRPLDFAGKRLPQCHSSLGSQSSPSIEAANLAIPQLSKTVALLITS